MPERVGHRDEVAAFVGAVDPGAAEWVEHVLQVAVGVVVGAGLAPLWVGHRSHPAVGVVAVFGAAALGVDLGHLLAGRAPDLLATVAQRVLLGGDRPAGLVMVPAPLLRPAAGRVQGATVLGIVREAVAVVEVGALSAPWVSTSTTRPWAS